MPSRRKSPLPVILVAVLGSVLGLLSNVVSGNPFFQSFSFQPVAWAVGIAFILFVAATVWQYGKANSTESTAISAEVLRTWRIQLTRIVRLDVTGLLNQPLYQAARIEYALEDRPDAVANDVNLMLPEIGREQRPLLRGTSVRSVLDAHANRLLILGAGGSGKTTLLLELSNQLLDRSAPDLTDPVPVLFFLGAWTPEFSSLRDWLASQMDRAYEIPPTIGAELIDLGHILPLLDGLDEVTAEYRQKCMESINQFRNAGGLVVSSRTEENPRLSKKLNLSGAVAILANHRGQNA